MRPRWAAASVGLRALAIVGGVWWVVGALVGLALIFLPGPGLPVLMLAALGLVPWIVIAVRDTDRAV